MSHRIISCSAIIVLLASVAVGALSMPSGAMAFGQGGGGRGGGGHFGGGGGHFGGGGVGGGHGGGFGGSHIGGFGGGHIGGGHFGGGHIGGFGGGHIGGSHFGGGHIGGFGGGHIGGGHFGGGHIGGLSGGRFGGAHGGGQFGGGQFGVHNGGHLGAAHFGGAQGLAGHSLGHGGLGHDPGGGRNFAGGNFAGRAFAGHNFTALGARSGFVGDGFAYRGFWGSYNGYGYGGWAGPVFWPYAYDYMFGYIFSPWPYYDPFWVYGPFNLYASLFWPYPWAPYYAEVVDDYGYDPWLPFSYGDVYGDAPGYARTHVARARRAATVAAAETPAEVSGMCGGQAENLTGLPIEQIDQTVQPTGDQQVNLEALKAASAKVNEILAASCPSEIPMTAPGRLASMENRIDAMRQAVDTVRAPLEKFYGSLSDEQRDHFNAMRVGSEQQAARGRARKRETVASSAEICRAQTQGYSTAFPEQEIEKSIQLTDAQKATLDELRAAATKGPDLLKDTCPSEMPSTPTGRLRAVQARLDAMLEAVKTERPAMDKFYSSLTDEQKARFNALRPPQQPTRHEG
jgi:hypothetical protein